MISYTIPRGIKVRETIAYGLNGKQLIYLAFGIGGAVGIISLPIPIDLKIAGSVLSSVGSIFLSIAKVHGQDLDRYALNSIKYPLRQKEWSNNEEEEESTIKIRFRSRQPNTV